ncbi:MAG: hypothetical protein WCO12_00860 [bacterium]
MENIYPGIEDHFDSIRLLISNAETRIRDEQGVKGTWEAIFNNVLSVLIGNIHSMYLENKIQKDEYDRFHARIIDIGIKAHTKTEFSPSERVQLLGELEHILD